MAIVIKLKQVRHSPRKLRPVARILAGKSLEVALNQSFVMTQDSARFMYKALKMAEAAASQKELKTDELKVASIQANDGPRIKRMRPNARGRSNRYRKHIAHIVVTLAPADKKEDAKPAKAQVKKTKVAESPKETA